MVKKLYKYEFKSYGIWVLLLYGAMLASSLIIIVSSHIFADDVIFSAEFLANTKIDEMAISASMSLYRLSITACFIMVAIMPLVRFYKNLLTAEGYLTLSLPISPSKHIICKTAVALVYQLGATFALMISWLLFIIGSGDAEEVFKFLSQIIEWISKAFFELEPQYIFDIIAIAIAALLTPLATLLMCYFCLASSMLFGKLKLLGSAIVLFIISAASSTISSIGFVISIPLFSSLRDPGAILAIISFGALIIVIAEIVGFFIATKYLFTHKVNL